MHPDLSPNLVLEPTTTTVKPGVYEYVLQSQTSLVVVLDEQSTDGPVRAIRIVRSELNARWLKPLGVSITPDHVAVLKLFAAFFEW